jgi:hypothetical protein
VGRRTQKNCGNSGQSDNIILVLHVLDITVAELSTNIGDNIAHGIYLVLFSFSLSITLSPAIPFKGEHANAELSGAKQLLTVLIKLLVWRLIQKGVCATTLNSISYSVSL